MSWFEFSADNAPTPAFIDAATARAWLSGQPQAMPAKMLVALLQQLERLAAKRDIDPFNRASIIESLRPAVHTTEAAERKRFAYHPRPLNAEQSEQFDVHQRLWLALAGNYLQCLDAYGRQQPVNELVAATAAHRALVTLRQALEVAFGAGVAPDPALWWHLHRVAQVVAQLGLGDLAIADPEFPQPATTTATQQYLMAVLLTAVDPYRWTPGQYAVAHRAFSRWRDLAVLSTTRDDDPRHRWLPLAALPLLPEAIDASSPAWVEVHLIRRKLRKRIEALDAGATPEKLNLGRELSPTACRAFLESLADRLRAAYGGATPTPVPVGHPCEMAIGTEAAWETLAGRTLDIGPTLNVISARILHERVALFGQTSAEKQESRPLVGGESWLLDCETIEAADVSRPVASGGKRMLPGGLAVLRAEHSTSLSHIKRVWVDGEARVHARVRRFPGIVAALVGRSPRDPNLPGFPVFALSAVDSLDSPASVILPSGVAVRLRGVIDVRGEDTWSQIQLGGLIERGADFERFALPEPSSG